MIDRRSWVTGLLMRLAAGPVVVKGSREPVAYLYGKCSEPLPDIYEVYTPELQETYPYVHIYVGAGNTSYRQMYACSSDIYVKKSDDKLYHKTTFSYCVWRWRPGRDTWEYQSTWADQNNVNAWDNADELLWTSTDILYDDGSVYLGATDPVPVYE